MRFLPRPPPILTHRNINSNLIINILMNKKIGLFWLRDDFRVLKNYGLIEATRSHDQVVVFYLYKKHNNESSHINCHIICKYNSL